TLPRISSRLPDHPGGPPVAAPRRAHRPGWRSLLCPAGTAATPPAAPPPQCNPALPRNDPATQPAGARVLPLAHLLPSRAPPAGYPSPAQADPATSAPGTPAAPAPLLPPGAGRRGHAAGPPYPLLRPWPGTRAHTHGSSPTS